MFSLIYLPSCTTIEVAANLGKKIIPENIKNKNKFRQKAIYKVGLPYKVDNLTYYPKKDLNYNETGIASWYGPKFHGKLTANGEIFNQYEMTAAHKTLPMPSAVQVINLENGLSIIVRINDRGPFVNERIIDLSTEAAKRLKLYEKGTGLVRVKLLRSESIFLEKLAKKGEFPEIDKIEKFTKPPIQKPVATKVQIVNIANKKNKKTQNPEVDLLKRKLKVLDFNNKKYNIWIQIAAFTNVKSAKVLYNKFKYINKINIHKKFLKGKDFFRVRVGPFLKIENAEDIYNFLIKKGMQGTKIIIE